MGGFFFDFELFRTAFDGRCSAQAQEEEDPDQTGDPGQMDAKAHERHKEITLRNKKREMMEAFTVLTQGLFRTFPHFKLHRRRRRDRQRVDASRE